MYFVELRHRFFVVLMRLHKIRLQQYVVHRKQSWLFNDMLWQSWKKERSLFCCVSDLHYKRNWAMTTKWTRRMIRSSMLIILTQSIRIMKSQIQFGLNLKNVSESTWRNLATNEMLEFKTFCCLDLWFLPWTKTTLIISSFTWIPSTRETEDKVQNRPSLSVKAFTKSSISSNTF